MRPAFSIAAGPPDVVIDDLLEGQIKVTSAVTALNTSKTITALKDVKTPLG